MKPTITIALVLTCISFLSIQEIKSNELSRRWREASELCRDTEQTPNEIIEKIISGDFDEDDIERAAMCHIKCMMEGFGILKNGGLSERRFIKKLSPHVGEEKARELYDFCQNENDGDECEKPFKMYLCLKKLTDIFEY